MESIRIFNTELLFQQVMSPVVTAAGSVPIKLTGAENFKIWSNTLAMHISDVNSDWFDYINTGKINAIVEEYNPSVNLQLKIMKIFETALKTLIMNNIEGNAKKEANKYLTGYYGNPSGRGLLFHLVAKYNKNTIGVISAPFFKINELKNMSADSQRELIEKLVRTMFEYTQDEEILRARLNEEDRALFESSRIQSCEKAAALLLMGVNEEHYQRFMDLLGEKDFTTMEKVHDIIKKSNESANNHALIGAHSKVKNNNKKFKKEVKCKNCKGNHVVYDCPEFLEWKKNKQKESSSNGWFAFVGRKITNTKYKWYFDTGCTQHITCEKDQFKELVLAEDDSLGYIEGIGGKTPIKGYGTVVLGKITLNNVAYVPDSGVNLISIKMATKRSGTRFLFDKDYVYTISDNKTEIVGYCKNDLYIFGSKENNDCAVPSVMEYAYINYDINTMAKETVAIPESVRWHARVGHPGLANYNRLANQLSLPIMIKDNYTLCPTCSLSKGIVRKGKSSNTVYSAPLQLIQVDVCGHFKYTGFSDDKYFLTIRDAYSRYYTVIHLTKKSESCSKLIDWILKTANYFVHRDGFKVCAIRTDNGGEFISNRFHEFCKSKCVSHPFTVLHYSFQNGAVEHAHRTY